MIARALENHHRKEASGARYIPRRAAVIFRNDNRGKGGVGKAEQHGGNKSIADGHGASELVETVEIVRPAFLHPFLTTGYSDLITEGLPALETLRPTSPAQPEVLRPCTHKFAMSAWRLKLAWERTRVR
jgi:hypothetical protein